MIDDPSAKFQLTQNQTAQDFAQNLRRLDGPMTHDEKAQTYKRLQRKYYRPTSNIHIKQHIQRHRPQYVFQTPTASQIIDIDNESKSHSTVYNERRETGETSDPILFNKKIQNTGSSVDVD
jgi:SPX domain protein involved in polyphosphate accumulation